MSKPWKGWMSKPSIKRKIDGSAWLSERNDGYYCVPVLIQPIDDESLPHPGDGRVWETRAKSKVVDVVATDGDFVWVRYGPEDRRGFVCRPTDLRERKPEPEHKPWCHKTRLGSWSGTSKPNVACSCERRSGEDRRQGERRDGARRGTDVYPLPNRGRRSGTDRRSP